MVMQLALVWQKQNMMGNSGIFSIIWISVLRNAHLNDYPLFSFQFDRVFQQNEEMAGHGQPAKGVPAEHRKAGEELHCDGCHF